MAGTGWANLGTPASELLVDFTLPTGQSFRWRKTGPGQYTGVIHQRVVRVQQEDADVAYRILARSPAAHASQDAAVVHDYFNVSTQLQPLASSWAKKDERFGKLWNSIQGARVLRQDPVECLFQFICSSNNHISRIHGMVERLCSAYGTPLPLDPQTVSDLAVEGSAPITDGSEADDLIFYAFPTLDQLSVATEEELRAAGFGYRAKFITGTVAALQAKAGGGSAWLMGLRNVSYPEASEALQTLPGVGPKVAACVCLFALDKHAAIPVDTHVWQLAIRHYTPHLKGKTLTRPLMAAVEEALVARFGPYAGWAHNTLFIAELASQRQNLAKSDQPPKTKARSGSTPVKPLLAPDAPVSPLTLPTPDPPTRRAAKPSRRARPSAPAVTPEPASPLTPTPTRPVRTKRRRVMPGETPEPSSSPGGCLPTGPLRDIAVALDRATDDDQVGPLETTAGIATRSNPLRPLEVGEGKVCTAESQESDLTKVDEMTDVACPSLQLKGGAGEKRQAGSWGGEVVLGSTAKA